MRSNRSFRLLAEAIVEVTFLCPPFLYNDIGLFRFLFTDIIIYYDNTNFNKCIVNESLQMTIRPCVQACSPHSRLTMLYHKKIVLYLQKKSDLKVETTQNNKNIY